MHKLRTKRNHIKKNRKKTFKKFNKKVKSTYKKVFKVAKKIKKHQNKISRKFKLRGGTSPIIDPNDVMSDEQFTTLDNLNKCLTEKMRLKRQNIKLQRQFNELQNELDPRTPVGFMRPIPVSGRQSSGQDRTSSGRESGRGSATPYGDIVDESVTFYSDSSDSSDDD